MILLSTRQSRPQEVNQPTLRIRLAFGDCEIAEPISLPRQPLLAHSNMLTNSITTFSQRLTSTYDDDFIDRLNYVHTIYLLLGFALLIFSKSYVGDPLQCWVPKQWTGDWENYAEKYCFIENTYFVSMNNTNLPAVQTRTDREMIYYQWVPFILALMALFFYIPRAVWKIFSNYSGLALSDMMTAARKSAKEMKENKKNLDKLAERITSCAYNPAPVSSLRYDSSLFNLYIIKKVLVLLNLGLQFYFLNHFLGTNYTFWGYGILSDLFMGRHWQESGHFPRVAFCDLTVREMGNVNNWTVQCVLMVNMFNEKIFLFLWFWMIGVLAFTVINVFIWIRNRYSVEQRRSFLRTLYICGMDTNNYDDFHKKPLERFYNEVLKDDGVLVLRLLDSNGGRIQSSSLFKTLWDLFIASSQPNTPNIIVSSDDEKTPLMAPERIPAEENIYSDLKK